MTVLDQRVMRDDKLKQMKEGRTVYAESPELIRLMKKAIERENLNVKYERTSSGCWFSIQGK